MMNEAVSTIMTTNVVTISPYDLVTKADDILTKGKVHHLPVLDEGKLVGLLTTHDINRLSRSNIDFERTPIEDIMTTHLATLEPNAKVGTASEILLENLFHAIPIVDQDSHLMGLVTSFDLLKYSYNKAYPNSWWLQKGSQRMAASHVSVEEHSKQDTNIPLTR